MSKDERFLVVFGLTMREFRTARGFSQYHLANVSGCSRRHINRIEAGDQEARISTLHKLAQALGVTLADIGAALDKHLAEAGVGQVLREEDAEKSTLPISSDVTVPRPLRVRRVATRKGKTAS